MLQSEKSAIRNLLPLAGALLAALLLAACAAPAPVEKPDTSELYWPGPPLPPAIRWVGSRSEIEELEIKRSAFADLIAGKEPEKPVRTFNKPFGVYADARGRLFVTDTALPALVVFDQENDTIEQWGQSGMGTLVKPMGITGDRQGRIYVVDSVSARVVVFDADGRFVNALGGRGVLENPVDVAINEDLGRIYVSDSKLHQIKVFDTAGGELFAFGEKGPGPEEFMFPGFLEVAPDGRLFVSDSLNFRIQVLDAEGKHLGFIGRLGRRSGELNRPKGVALDRDGHLYVIDASFNNFQVFEDDGRLLLAVGTGGNARGQFFLPMGIHIDDRDRIYVADQINRRVQNLRVPRRAPGGVSRRGEARSDLPETASHLKLVNLPASMY
jgi:DNA-binding beta-propeller fold protein YncE